MRNMATIHHQPVIDRGSPENRRSFREQNANVSRYHVKIKVVYEWDHIARNMTYGQNPSLEHEQIMSI